MKKFIKNLLFIFLILFPFSKNVYSENNKILNLLSICADKNYSNIDVENVDSITYENDPNYISDKTKLDKLEKQKLVVAKKYISEREKFVAEFPEPTSKSYSQKQWEKKREWEKNKSSRLSPFRENLEQIVIEISDFQKIINDDIKKYTFDYLQKSNIQSKSKKINGYIDSVQKCENEYENFPITFKLKWS